MIPVSLTIEGLYSYQCRQTIDFTDLTDAGLFGIFGAVGSGKSSILEAITFALYGETERMNSRDNRNYNMMNLRSARSYIDFEFLNHENKHYRITRAYRRNSKNYEDVKAADTVLYIRDKEDWTPLESSRVEEIIGLSYQNFKRTIIIPQGQFKEFLELGATDRTRMLKEIFNLQRFDLQAKTAALFAETRSRQDHQEGQLLGFEQITAEAIATKTEQLEKEEIIFREQENTSNAAAEALSQLRHLKEDMELLQQKQEQFAQLSEQKPAKDALAEELAVYETIQGAFSALLGNIEQTQNDLQHKQQQSEQERIRLTQLRDEGNLLHQKLKELEPAMATLPQKRIEEAELLWIGQLLQLEREIAIIKERQSKGQEFVAAVAQKVTSLKAEQVQLQTQVDTLKAARPDATVLLEVEKWWGQKETLDQKLSEAINNQDTLNTTWEQQQQELVHAKVNPLTYVSDFDQEQQLADQALEQLRQEHSRLQVQEQLAQYAHTLEDGTPCPLCGALEHPDVAAVEDVSKEMVALQQGIMQQNEQLKLIAARRLKAEQLIFQRNNTIQQKEAATSLATQIKTAITAHKEVFRWPEFNAAERQAFEQQKQHFEVTEREITGRETLLNANREALQKEQDNLEKANHKLESLKIDCARNEAQAAQCRNNIKQLDVTQYRHYTPEACALQQQELKTQNDKLEADYEHYNRALNNINPVIAAQESKLSGIDTRIAELTLLLEKQEQQAEQLLQAHQLHSLEAVKDLLRKQFDIAAIRNELQSFRVAYESLRIGINELTEKLKGKTFDSEEFLLQEAAVAEQQTALKAFAAQIAQLKGDISREAAELEKKRELIEALNSTRNRADQLNVLKKLFDRAGFVEYVSSIYLRQLCDMANVRFHRLTRNQLSLQLNDNNDFEIIDYLNEGRRRSVKTLSGGQSFQASLSLALALAESVQTNAKADRNFFFIDEGFGTQDAASVHIVFETLKHLQKENRIVGIISHVDELKDKIPVSLSVVKDEEQGSRIEKNLS